MSTYSSSLSQVAGDASEEQVLVAAQVYRDRPELLQKVLNDLFHVFRYEACSQPRLALDVVMAAMARHLPHKHIQIAGRFVFLPLSLASSATEDASIFGWKGSATEKLKTLCRTRKVELKNECCTIVDRVEAPFSNVVLFGKYSYTKSSSIQIWR